VPLQIRVQLVNGAAHSIELPGEDPGDVLTRLQTGSEPFNSEWLDAGNGELIRMSAIVSMRIEPADGGPLVDLV
jgi:hypothetical protein